MANQHTTRGQPKRKNVRSARYTDPELAKVTRLAKKKKLGVSEYIRERSLEDEKRT